MLYIITCLADAKLCPSTHYRCANKVQCIEIHQVMDGIVDCLDKSDENIQFSGLLKQ